MNWPGCYKLGFIWRRDKEIPLPTLYTSAPAAIRAKTNCVSPFRQASWRAVNPEPGNSRFEHEGMPWISALFTSVHCPRRAKAVSLHPREMATFSWEEIIGDLNASRR